MPAVSTFKSVRGELLLTLAAAALAIATAVGAWVHLQEDSALNMWAIATVIVAVIVGACAASAVLLPKIRSIQAVRIYIDRLSRLEPSEMTNSAADAISVPSGKWHSILARLKDQYISAARRLQEAEHARTAQDIRLRRAIAQCDRATGVLAMIDEPVIAVDELDEIVLTNASAQRLFGIDGDSCEHRALAQVVRCQRLVDLLNETRKRRGAGTRSDQIDIGDANGRDMSYAVKAARLASVLADDQAEGAVAVLRDISNEKKEQKQYAEFVSAVTHEMKAPLAGIKAYVELLADGDAADAEEREEFLNVINSQADRLQRLIDNTLSLARIEAGVTKVSKENRSLNDILAEALEVVRPSAERKSMQITSDLSPLYLNIYADRDTLLQAAINLLSNAIKYTPEGGRVTLRSRMSENQEVLFEVEDSGVGLTEEDCHRVFEKFYRVKKDSEMATGTGLGLTLVKHIIEEIHGGRISVRSRLGKGSTFSVLLPAAACISSSVQEK